MRLSARIALAAAVAFLRCSSEEHGHQHQVGKLGRAVLPVSCTPAARQRFEHAMAVLHSFWWEEGDRAFGNVVFFFSVVYWLS